MEATRVAGPVWVLTCDFWRSNTVAVEGEDGWLLVDPNVTADDLAGIADWLEAREARVVVGVATHPHWDHVLWHPRYGHARRVASRRAAEHADATLERSRADAAAQAGLDPDLVGPVRGLTPGLARLDWAGPDVVLVEHDGHAPGHLALWLPGEGVLVGGDMLSDVEIPLLDLDSGAVDPYGDYADGLIRLAGPVGEAQVLVPGHGSLARGSAVPARLAADRAYLAGLREPEDPGDPRLRGPAGEWMDWLRSEHRRQRTLVGRPG